MSNENQRVIPTNQPADLPGFRIKIGGSDINPEYKVLAVETAKVYNKISYARITISDGDAASQKFDISDKDDFKPGNEIEVHAGYHNEVTVIFKGIITAHNIRIKNQRANALIIEARDKAIKLTSGRKSAYFYELKDSEIIEQLASPSGVTTEIEATPVKHKEMVQYHVSDWDFILARAEATGLLLLTDDNKLIAKKASTSGATALQVEFGATMLDFEAEMDSGTQVKAIKSKSWDPAEQKLLETEGSDPAFGENGNITAATLADVFGVKEDLLLHTGKFQEQELKELIDARTMRRKMARIKGHARFQGWPDIKPGMIVDLKGVGARFSGKVFVTGVRHQLTKSNWVTDIQFGFSEKFLIDSVDLADQKAAGMLPGINGLHIGLVTKIGSDPDGEDRIQVKMPVLDDAAEGVWARVLTPDAGKKRGIFFRPDVGDEVLLGFLNDDPRQPVVLGMLNSKKLPAPVTAENDDNHIKGIYTRSEIKFFFDDDKKIVTLETPGKQSVIVNDDKKTITLTDATGNSVELSDKGITFKSKKDIILDAASGDIKMTATNIKAEASAQLTAKGSAGAEVSAGGNMVVKGAMVQIN